MLKKFLLCAYRKEKSDFFSYKNIWNGLWCRVVPLGIHRERHIESGIVIGIGIVASPPTYGIWGKVRARSRLRLRLRFLPALSQEVLDVILLF